MTSGRPDARPIVGALALGTVLWVVILIAAPVAAGYEPADPAFRVAGLVYLFGRTICHQRPERSFQLNGVQLPVCARCLGLYVGAAAGAGLVWGLRRYPSKGKGQRAEKGKGAVASHPFIQGNDARRGALPHLCPLPFALCPYSDIRLVLGVAALPTLLTAIVELTGLSAVAGSVRFAAALPLGAGAAWLAAAAATGLER